jgi:amino acid transporter
MLVPEDRAPLLRPSAGGLDETYDEHEFQTHHRRRSSSMLEHALESLHDVAEHVEEVLEEIVEEAKEVLHEEIVPVLPRESGEHDQRLGVIPLAVLVFYKVSGGPFGCEPAVKAAGPFYAILGFVLFPLLWAVPEALITAELGSAFPEPSGGTCGCGWTCRFSLSTFRRCGLVPNRLTLQLSILPSHPYCTPTAVAWVEEAFGPKASLLCGYFHWLSGATDNAIYPTLFLSYIAEYLKLNDQDELLRFLVTVFLAILLSIVNYMGLEIVGNLSVVLAIISMSPFIILCIVAIPKLDPSRWLVRPTLETMSVDDDTNYDTTGFISDPEFDNVHWRLFMNTLFWNLNSFDAGASFAGEVRDPERVFPRAMFVSVVLVTLGYILPLLASLGGADTNQRDWSAGYFTAIARDIGGNWLGIWLVVAAAVSNIGLYEAEMSGDAYQLMGMADRGLIPKAFAKRSRFGTPENGILLNTWVIILMSVADFEQLVEMLNFAYSLAFLMQFAAFIRLRIDHPDIERPYRIPLNTFGCVLFILPACLFLIYLMLIASKLTYVYFAGLTLVGICFHLFQKCSKHYKWVEYVEAPKRQRTNKKKAADGSQNI